MAKLSVTNLIVEKLSALEKKVDAVRTEDIPGLKTAMEVQKVVIEERTSKRATIITGLGAAITFLVTIGAAYALSWLK